MESSFFICVGTRDKYAQGILINDRLNWVFPQYASVTFGINTYWNSKPFALWTVDKKTCPVFWPEALTCGGISFSSNKLIWSRYSCNPSKWFLCSSCFISSKRTCSFSSMGRGLESFNTCLRIPDSWSMVIKKTLNGIFSESLFHCIMYFAQLKTVFCFLFFKT